LRFAVLTQVLIASVAFAHAENASIAALETGPCSLEEAVPVMVAQIDSDLDILLDDGRRVTIAGVEFPLSVSDAPTLRDDASRRLSDWLTGKLVFFAALAQTPDRWGRIPARLFAGQEGDETALAGVGETLLEAGLGRFRPDRPAGRCAKSYLDAEQRARVEKMGLWGSKVYAILDARNIGGAINTKGMVIAEGVITSIGEARGSIYLNFGPRRGVDFTVVISKHNAGTFDRAGLPLRRLSGRRVRARGLIEIRSGPRMEIASPAEIELVDGSPAP
jgi:hypothetical protein